MDHLYTNRSRQKDFIQNAFETYGRNCEVRIASAFFSAHEVIKDFADRGCTVRLIVRLGSGTRADSLSRAILNENVQLRCFVWSGFHPKLYLFGGSACLVGSANLTGAGKWSNAEVAVMLPSEDPRFDELSVLFEEYWDEAYPLDKDALERYRQLEQANPKEASGIDAAVEKEFGKHSFSNIEREKAKSTPKDRYRERFRRDTQEFRQAFLEVQTVYNSIGNRLAPHLPLRIEIDQLFNFIREEDAPKDAYREVPLLNTEQRKAKIQAAVNQFADANHAELLNIEQHKLPKILERLGSKESIMSSSEDEIFDVLKEIYAFQAYLRYLGGESLAKKQFFQANSLGRVRTTLCFLLHSNQLDAVTRIADCIYNPEYKLESFGQSCVEETFGWVNKDDVPICNGRALKSIRWLGFKVNA
jgi:phospholipase D-like protein